MKLDRPLARYNCYIYTEFQQSSCLSLILRWVIRSVSQWQNLLLGPKSSIRCRTIHTPNKDSLGVYLSFKRTDLIDLSSTQYQSYSSICHSIIMKFDRPLASYIYYMHTNFHLPSYKFTQVRKIIIVSPFNIKIAIALNFIYELT